MSYEYWKQKRGDRPMPAESDLDPAEIRKILPHVILLDVRQEPLDFHYRLIGTKMDEHMLGRYTGLWMSQIPHQRSPSRVWTNCRRVALEGRPLSGDTPYVGKGKEFLTTEDLLMPLSDDRSEEHTSELQSLMRISYAVFCLKKKTKKKII